MPHYSSQRKQEQKSLPWSKSLLLDPVFQQLAPLLVVLIFPLLFFFCATRLRWLIYRTMTFVDSLGLSWLWSSGSSQDADSSRRNGGRRKHPRTRAEQLEMLQKSSGSSTHKQGVEDGYYPGLVNVSGTYCFMNTTLQAMASLTYFQPQIEAMHSKAEQFDVATPVIDAVYDLMHVLNTPKSSPSALRPMDIIRALSTASANNKVNSLFSSREHQDAQELFQLVTECVKQEAASIDREAARDRGFGNLQTVASSSSSSASEITSSKSVFDGLTANRRSCMDCGYTEAVMHFPFDSWQLAVPRLAGAVRLEECLMDYTRLELLSDCICRKCSMLATHRRLVAEAEKLTKEAADEHASASKKKKAREARKLEQRVKAAIEEGRIEEDVKGVKMEKVFSKASTKQAMIARPPPVLALHLNRSMMYGQYAAKNNVRIVFPEVLDLTPFTTSGSLSTDPSNPISPPPPPPPSAAPFPRATTPTATTYTTPRTLYRLAAVVCHYGGHNSGHYICFRRKPRPPSAGAKRFRPPRMPHVLGCECKRCITEGPIRDLDSEEEEEEEEKEQEHSDKHDDNHYEEKSKKRRRTTHSAYGGWLRISDDSVREVGLDAVLAEGSGAFMLYYERVAHPRPAFAPHDSVETLKPSQARLMMAHAAAANGSTVSLPVLTTSHSSLVDGGEDERRLARSVSTARIVRSVQAGRARSASAAARLRVPLQSPSEGSGDGDLTPRAADTRSINGDTIAASRVEPLSSSTPALLPSSLTNGHVSPSHEPSSKSSGVPPPTAAAKKKRTKSSSKHRVHSPESRTHPHDHHHEQQQRTPSTTTSSSIASSVSPLVDSKA